MTLDDQGNANTTRQRVRKCIYKIKKEQCNIINDFTKDESAKCAKAQKGKRATEQEGKGAHGQGEQGEQGGKRAWGHGG